MNLFTTNACNNFNNFDEKKNVDIITFNKFNARYASSDETVTRKQNLLKARSQFLVLFIIITRNIIFNHAKNNLEIDIG